jgi:hypothetical protein
MGILDKEPRGCKSWLKETLRILMSALNILALKLSMHDDPTALRRLCGCVVWRSTLCWKSNHTLQRGILWKATWLAHRRLD